MISYLVRKTDEKQHGPPQQKGYQYTVFDQCHTEILDKDEIKVRINRIIGTTSWVTYFYKDVFTCRTHCITVSSGTLGYNCLNSWNNFMYSIFSVILDDDLDTIEEEDGVSINNEPPSVTHFGTS